MQCDEGEGEGEGEDDDGDDDGDDDENNNNDDESEKLRANEYAYFTAQDNLAKSSEHIIEIVIPSTTAAHHTRVASNTNEICGTGGGDSDAMVNESYASYQYRLSSSTAASVAKNLNDSAIQSADSTSPDTQPQQQQQQQQRPPSSSSQSPPPQPRCGEYGSKPKIILHLPPRKTKKIPKTRRRSNSEDENEISDDKSIAVGATVTATTAAATAANTTTTTAFATIADSPLQRLSRDELMSLLKLSEKDLKENLVKALEEKEST